MEALIGELIHSELETHLTRLVKKAKRKAVRERAKLN